MTWIGTGVTLSPHTETYVLHEDIKDTGYEEDGK